MHTLEGKVAIVVGGGRGIGMATVRALSRAGAAIVVQDLGCDPEGEHPDPKVAASLASELVKQGGRAIASDTDITAPGAAAQVVKLALDTFGQVDAGVYCAGLSLERPLLRTSDDELQRVLDVHVSGAARFTRELARSLLAQKRPGSILLMSGAAGFFGTSGQCAYATAAAAVAGFARTAASELRRHQIRVNALAPTARTRLTERLPLFRSIRPDSLTTEHVAQVAAFLVSDAASEIQGEVLGVAGGRIYGLRSLETSGVFLEGPPAALEEIGARLPLALAP